MNEKIPDADDGAPHDVECAVHGTQQKTLVCQHVVDGLRRKERVGFFWTQSDPAKARPDAWCSGCEERVQLTDGEWIGEAADHLQPKTLCGACYDLAKLFHMGGEPWS